VDNDVRKTFATSVWSLLRELSECTTDVKVEWRLFETVAPSSAARECGQKRLVVPHIAEK